MASNRAMADDERPRFSGLRAVTHKSPGLVLAVMRENAAGAYELAKDIVEGADPDEAVIGVAAFCGAAVTQLCGQLDMNPTEWIERWAIESQRDETDDD